MDSSISNTNNQSSTPDGSGAQDKDTARDLEIQTTPDGVLPTFPKIPSLEEIDDRISKRNLTEAFVLLAKTWCRLGEARGDIDTISASDVAALRSRSQHIPWQIGDLINLPARGRAFVFSDLEGSALIEKAFRKHEIIQRLEERNVDDPVYVISMGDAIDRSDRATKLMELLYELQGEPGVSSQIIALAGTHELDPSQHRARNLKGDQQKEIRFRDEIDENRSSYQQALDVKDEDFINAVHWYATYCANERLEDRLREAADSGNWGDGVDPIVTMRSAVYRLYLGCFQLAPKCIRTESGIFMPHAGPTNKGVFSYLNGLDPTICRPTVDECLAELAMASSNKELLDDLTWSCVNGSIDRFGPNMRGPVVDNRPTKNDQGVHFGVEGLKEFLNLIEARIMIRGHEHYCGKYFSGGDKAKLRGSSDHYSGIFSFGPSLTVHSNQGNSLSYLEIDLSRREGDKKMIKMHSVSA